MKKFAAFMTVFILLLGSAMVYYSYINFKEYKQYQHGIAKELVKGATKNISGSIASLKKSLRIFVESQRKKLSELNTEGNFTFLDKQLSRYFDDYHSFTVADKAGVLLYDDFEERVGNLCRKDIVKFALSKGRTKTYIHPGPSKYHFDVMLNWKMNNKDLVLFASFGTKRIANILRNAQAPGHELFLLRKDIPSLIEVSAKGNRSQYTDLIKISKEQQSRILYQTDVKHTRWVLVDIVPENFNSQRASLLIIRDIFIFLVLVLTSAIMLRRIIQGDKHQKVTEEALKDSNAELVSNAEKRVYEVGQSNLKLQLEVDNRRKLSRAVEQADDIIVITDSTGKVEYVNPAFERSTGFELNEVSGSTLNKIQSGKHSNKFFEEMWQQLNKGEVFRSVFINRRKDGSLYHEEKTITPIRVNEQALTHFVSTGKDITDRIAAEKHMKFLAYHDALTELPNRMMFIERLDAALNQVDQQTLLAVLFIDLDRFKTINDSLGHDMGDYLLKAIADRLQFSLGSEDIVSRLGGDEFALIISSAQDINSLRGISRTILNQVAHPVIIDDYELYTTASIGLVIVSPADKSSASLLKHADTAMYHAKEKGGNCFELYSSEMGKAASRRLDIENQFHNALARDEFSLHYQPRVCMATGQVTGAEALLRWNSPEFGTVSPVEFIPLLEETGKIIEVGKWVLMRACADFANLDDSIRLAVNLSPRQFIDNRLEHDVIEILSDTSFPPQLLDIEITEGLLVQDRVRVTHILHFFHDQGIKISIDDFGTGYSSLSYLKDYPIDCLKIDRSFVSGLPDDMSNVKLVSAIISMAHSLNMTVVTEGVETEEQLAIVQQQKTEEVQGYLFSRPLPFVEFKKWLEEYNASINSSKNIHYQSR